MNFFRHDPPRKTELQHTCGDLWRVKWTASRSRVVAAKVKNVIATSGTAAALAAAASHLRKNGSRQRAVVTRAEMTRIAKQLSRLPVDERQQIEGIGPRRAEIIVAGAIVYHELLDRCHLNGFRYSPLGLRDGLLAQMAAEHDRSTRSGKQIESERWDSIRAPSQHYQVDMKHALEVRESAMYLFAALQVRSWLAAGIQGVALGRGHALRSGRLREPQRPHRHTYYIISNSEILGYTPQQRRHYRGHCALSGKVAADGWRMVR